MYIEVKCPIHNKPLYGNGQTSTHKLFKCPDCDYDGGEGVVRQDLPERFIALETENKKLRHEVVGWMNWTYYLPKDWVPKGLMSSSKKALKE